MLTPRSFTIHAHDLLACTQDEAHRRLAAGETDFAVRAGRQSAGRGRRGRAWEAPAGAALLCSFGLVLPDGAAPAGPLFALALAALETAASFLPDGAARLRVKWPNDLWADGKKLAGLLGEARGNRLALGIGFNLAQDTGDFPAELLVPPASLKMLGAAEVSAGEFLAALTEKFAAKRLLLESGGLPAILARLAPHWQFRSGDRLQLQEGDTVISGECHGVADDGALRLRPDGETGVRSYHAAEVSAVRPASVS